MAITDENMVMPVTPMGAGNGGLFGGGDSWLGILFLIALLGGGWGGLGGFGGFGGYGAMMGMGMMDGWGLYPWLNNSQNINDGFRSQSVGTQINGIQNAITSGFGDVQTALCGGFGGVNQNISSGVATIQNSLCNGFNGVNNSIFGAQTALAQQMYTNQIADMERSFAAQTQAADCCCKTQSGIADLKYTVASENCADRAALSDGVRDILAATQAQTQVILDRLCADKIEAKNDTIAQLRSELLYARGQASQDVQTAAIQAGQRLLANEVEQYVAPRPIPAYSVQNPNCCYNTCGCGVA